MTTAEIRRRQSEGGRADTAAKREALAALHAARRGRRVNAPGVSAPALAGLLAAIGEAVREPIRDQVSIRALARHVGRSDRTVRRWLSGMDWPDAESVRAMRRWVRGAGNGRPT